MQSARANRPAALTIAGSDSGGGAGVPADLKTFAALEVYGFSVITSVIAQNSARVFRMAPMPPTLVAAQIEAVAAERRAGAVKTGALATAAIVGAVADSIIALRLPAPVVDPVMVASSGARLLDRAGQSALAERLIPLARVVTPNLLEAQTLSGIEIDGSTAAHEAARRIVALGARAVVIKGGHLAPGFDAIDLLYNGRSFISLSAPRLKLGDAHGTGCAFSAAIAAHLARGRDLENAVRGAKQFVTAALRASFRFGAGRPLLDHFAAGSRAIEARKKPTRSS
jgi:hydroxymethylpyrimidine/phosphomethylpyrimidine kinase